MRLDTDFVLPASIDHDTGACLKLWGAVLQAGIIEAARGFFEIQKHKAATPDAPLKVTENVSAYYWLVSNRNTPGSFVWLCDLFNADAEQTRGKLRSRFREIAKWPLKGANS